MLLRDMVRSRIGTAFLLPFLVLGGCALSGPASRPQAKSGPTVATKAPDPAQIGWEGQADDDRERFAALWKSRTHGSHFSDYPVGPGDVLQISVPSIEELRERTVRVSGENAIALPLIGVVYVAGLTEAGLREELGRRLENYMYAPQVEVFVKEYRSRQVAVLGAVDRPGHFSLTGGTDTILDMITLAGGLREDAADRIVMIPAEATDGASVDDGAVLRASYKQSPDGEEAARSAPRHGGEIAAFRQSSLSPIVIPLGNIDRGGDGANYLNLPVRPGDVLVVPGGGSAMVEGWVRNPGAVRITPGLTVLGAVAAAGGSLFAANTRSVDIIRSGKRGEKIILKSNLDEIVSRQKPDLEVQQDDIIVVTYSGLTIVPYFFYTVFNRFGIGAGVPMAP
jgi:polysaccharide export outer membrane protein